MQIIFDSDPYVSHKFKLKAGKKAKVTILKLLLAEVIFCFPLSSFKFEDPEYENRHLFRLSS